MARYEVQFKSSGIVAFSATEKSVCQHWYDCNNYGPEKPYCDPETGEIVPYKWVEGECLNLFTIKRCATPKRVK